jgi:hypothetical protein
MGIGEILDRTLRIYRGWFATFFGIAVVASGLIYLVSVALGFASPPDMRSMSLPEMLVLAAKGLVLLAAVALLQTALDGALTVAASEHFLGRPIGVRDAYRRMMPRFLPLLGTAVLKWLVLGGIWMAVAIAAGIAVAAIAALLGAAGGIVGGVVAAGALGAILLPGLAVILYLYLSFFLSTYAVVLEGLGPVRALARSHELMRKKTDKTRWRFRSNASKAMVILLVILIWTIGVSVSFMALNVALQEHYGGFNDPDALAAIPWYVNVVLGAVSTLLQTLSSPVYGIAPVLLYYDIRMRFEGFDLIALADTLSARQE